MHIPIIAKVLEYYLKLAGLFPGYFSILRPLLIISPLFTTIPFQCWDVARSFKNQELKTDSLGDITSEICIQIKIIILLSRRSDLIDLLREMANDFDKTIVVEKWLTHIKSANRFCKYNYAIYAATICLFHIRFVLMYVEVSVENRVTVIEAYYPFDYQSSPIFEILYIIHAVQGALMGTLSSMSETLLIVLVIHASGHIGSLLDEIKLFSENCHLQKNPYPLSNLIKKHKKVLDFVNKIDKIYSNVSFIQVVSSGLIICFYGFVVITTNKSQDKVQLIKYFLAYAATLWQTFCFCCASQYLINKSEMIPNEMYNIPWYKLKPTEIKTVCLIIYRSQNLLALNAGKFAILSFRTFAMIIKTSFTYLSVLRAVYS